MRWRWIIPFVLGGALIGVVLAGVAGAAPRSQIPPVPHTIEEREACLSCHSAGEQAVPTDHAGRGNETCLQCHLALVETPTSLASPSPAATRATPPATELPTFPPVVAGEYKGPEFCAGCHKPHYQEWYGSTHAEAFQDEAFQRVWAENRKPGYCLACHATGYNPNTGMPIAEGVTCESCHGTYKEGHPQTDMMPVDPAAERCGVCHTTTYQEWQLSGHGQRGVKCASCHAVHSQGLLFATSTALCATCHGDRAEDYAHATHAQHGVMCADCHMYRPPDGPMAGGSAPTGHLFSVESQACTQCHTRDSIHSRRQEFALPGEANVSLLQRISVLEAQVGEMRADARRNLILGSIGGALGGLLVGALLSWFLLRQIGGKKDGPAHP